MASHLPLISHRVHVDEVTAVQSVLHYVIVSSSSRDSFIVMLVEETLFVLCPTIQTNLNSLNLTPSLITVFLSSYA